MSKHASCVSNQMHESRLRVPMYTSSPGDGLMTFLADLLLGVAMCRENSTEPNASRTEGTSAGFTATLEKDTEMYTINRTLCRSIYRT